MSNKRQPNAKQVEAMAMRKPSRFPSSAERAQAKAFLKVKDDIAAELAEMYGVHFDPGNKSKRALPGTGLKPLKRKPT